MTLQCSIADLDLIEGQLEPAQARFGEAYALAKRLDIPLLSTTSAVGALWASTLLGHMNEMHSWRQLVVAQAVPSQRDVRGRRALALGLSLLRHSEPDTAALADIVQEATVVRDTLQPPDRAYLMLLRAALVFEKDGWSCAASDWDRFVSYADRLPDTLLLHFAEVHRKLFESAARTSPLARRLVVMLQTSESQRWRITAFGTFACFVNDKPCRLSPLHRTLLVRLLDAGPPGLTVERLWEAVWGDTDIRMAALHKALARLREQTGLAVAARAGRCTIESPWATIEYDVLTFERALLASTSRQELERAVALYRGDFLPGAAPSAALWIDRRRSLLQQLYLDALDQLARLIEDDEPQQAIQQYQHILQIDGCREETASRLMRLAARQRNHALVNATFEQLEGALRTLGATPEPATVALLHAIPRGTLLERQRSVS